jgi:hypothetical protein
MLRLTELCIHAPPSGDALTPSGISVTEHVTG